MPSRGEIARRDTPSTAWFFMLTPSKSKNALAAEGLKMISPTDVAVGDFLPIICDDDRLAGKQGLTVLVWAEVINVAHDNSYMALNYGYETLKATSAATDIQWRSKWGRVPFHDCAITGHIATDLGGLIKSWCRHCNVTLWYHRDTGVYDTTDPFKKGA